MDNLALRFFVTAIGQGIVGFVVFLTLQWALDSGAARDAAIISLWALLIVAGTAIVILTPWRRIPTTVGDQSSESLGDHESPPERPFNSYQDMTTKIARIDLRGLWNDMDRYIEVIVQIRTASGQQVTISGVDGSVNIGGIDCSLAAHVIDAPRALPVDGPGECRIRQPITREMAEQIVWVPGAMDIRDDHARLRVSLSGMRWVGTVGGGTLPQRVVNDEVVILKGPDRESYASHEMFRVNEVEFVNQEVYEVGSGLPRPTPESAPDSSGSPP